MPRKVFVAGEILTAADVNTNLMDQAVMVFDDATDRATAIPTPVEGMTTYLKDTDLVEVFDGTDFVPVAIEPDPPAILQVVSTAKTDTFSSSATTFTTIPDMSASITPTTTDSKVLVVVNLKGASSEATSGGAFHYRIVRDSTAIAIGDARQGRSRLTGNLGTRASGSDVLLMADTPVFLDSPATTSSVTYSVEGRNTVVSAFFVNRFQTDQDSDFFITTVSSITLMEVAG